MTISALGKYLLFMTRFIEIPRSFDGFSDEANEDTMIPIPIYKNQSLWVQLASGDVYVDAGRFGFAGSGFILTANSHSTYKLEMNDEKALD